MKIIGFFQSSHEWHGAEYPQPKSFNAEHAEGAEVADYLESKKSLRSLLLLRPLL
jgi:hypothetical protein